MSDLHDAAFGGGCLCGAVTYEFAVVPKVTVACHCSACRTITGSAFGVWSLVPKDEFHWQSGVDQLAEYASSDHARRLFCRRCGTTLGNLTSRRPGFMHLAAGTLQRSPPLRLALHCYTASKAPWFEITDGLPQHPDEPSKRGP
jgi:hypothetical protein